MYGEGKQADHPKDAAAFASEMMNDLQLGVSDFEREMKRAGVDYALAVYPEAKHSFTVPDAEATAAAFNLPLGYDANADQASWRDLLSEMRYAFAPVLPDGHS